MVKVFQPLLARRGCPQPGRPCSPLSLGLLQMQLILHYDETYREVKYGNMGLPDIDSKMLIGINVTPIAALLYTPVLIRCALPAPEGRAVSLILQGLPWWTWESGSWGTPCLPGGAGEKG